MDKKDKKKYYLVVIGEADNVGFENTYELFETEQEADSFMREFVTQKIEDYEYSQEEIDEILENAENASYEEYYDLEDEWYIRMETAWLHK